MLALGKRHGLALNARLSLGDIRVKGLLFPFALLAAFPGPGRHLGDSASQCGTRHGSHGPDGARQDGPDNGSGSGGSRHFGLAFILHIHFERVDLLGQLGRLVRRRDHNGGGRGHFLFVALAQNFGNGSVVVDCGRGHCR